MSNKQNGPGAIATTSGLKDFNLSPEAEQMLPSSATLPIFLRRLFDGRLDVDAMRVLAHAMPLRRGIWWGALCVWHAEQGKPSPAEGPKLAAVVQWVVDPVEARRQAAASLAHGIVQTAADACLQAVAHAGSIPNPTAPLSPNDPAQAARMIEAAVFIAYAQHAKLDPTLDYRRFLVLGLQVAEGRIPWPLPPQSPRPGQNPDLEGSIGKMWK